MNMGNGLSGHLMLCIYDEPKSPTEPGRYKRGGRREQSEQGDIARCVCFFFFFFFYYGG